MCIASTVVGVVHVCYTALLLPAVAALHCVWVALALQVKFPQDNWITRDQLKELESLLPPRPPEEMHADNSVANLEVEEVRCDRCSVLSHCRVMGQCHAP